MCGRMNSQRAQEHVWWSPVLTLRLSDRCVEWAAMAVRRVLTSKCDVPVQEATLEDEAQDARAAHLFLLPT